jgi:DNA-binding XRE family transcriptional regulator
LTAYLGYDPFTNPVLGSPRGNEPSCVAFLSIDAPLTLGQKMKQNRLKLRKTRKQMARFLHPFCHLVIKAIRVDSPPCKNGQQLAEMLAEYRQRLILSRDALATRLGVSLGTLKNWERGRTKPSKTFWKQIRLLA